MTKIESGGPTPFEKENIGNFELIPKETQVANQILGKEDDATPLPIDKEVAGKIREIVTLDSKVSQMVAEGKFKEAAFTLISEGGGVHLLRKHIPNIPDANAVLKGALAESQKIGELYKDGKIEEFKKTVHNSEYVPHSEKVQILLTVGREEYIRDHQEPAA